MNNVTDNELKHYFKQIKTLFPVYSKNEKRFFENFQEDINDYIELKQNVSIVDIKNHFGQPTDIISNYLSELDNEILYKRLSTAKAVKGIIILAIILLISFFVFLGTLAYSDYQAAQHEQIEKEVVVIEEED